ncbi:MIZ/SP-RING zinc finger-containing protein [Elsinoe fawcettii]|nr:MIZ/SP-RING zinc finger-containing protein [Elsinoe fawcettii]
MTKAAPDADNLAVTLPELSYLIDVINGSFVPEGSIYSYAPWLPSAVQRTQQRRIEAFSLWLASADEAGGEKADPPTRHRLALILEALRCHDYYFLILNQAVCHAVKQQPSHMTDYQRAVLSIAKFFNGTDALSPKLQDFCMNFPLKEDYSKDQTEESSRILPRLVDMQRSLIAHVQACAERMNNSWVPFMTFCIEKKVLPLAQDIARIFGITSRLLQSGMFGVIMGQMNLSEEAWDAAETMFIASQERLETHRPLDVSETCESYRLIQNLLLGSYAPSPSSRPCPPSFFDNTYLSAISPEIFSNHGTDRYRPGSFRPQLMAPIFSRAESCNLFVSGVKLGPVRIPTSPITQTYSFFVTDEEYTSLVERRTTDGEKPRPHLHFEPRSCTFRLRICKATNESFTPRTWLAQAPDGAAWIYMTLNDHILELPHLKNQKIRPYDLTEMIVPGFNKLVLNINRTTTAKDPVKFAFAVEILSAISIDTIVSGCVNRQVTPTAEVLASIKKRLQPRDGDDDDLVMVDPALNITMTEPFSNSKIFDLPARTKSCKHDQPFDLRIFLESRPVRGNCGVAEQMKCPLCGADARPPEIVLDGFLMDVRNELKKTNRLDARTITVDEKGTWRIKEEEKAKEAAKGKTEVVVMELDD